MVFDESATVDTKKDDLLYNIYCSYNALRYSIYFIDENCQVRDIKYSKNCLFPW